MKRITLLLALLVAVLINWDIPKALADIAGPTPSHPDGEQISFTRKGDLVALRICWKTPAAPVTYGSPGKQDCAPNRREGGHSE